MRRKMLNVPKGSHDGMKGFTIVEFLVAGLLSMIVLMAVGSSYFTSRKLNDAANERLSAQQDLRNAATLIVRDARMAGSFGCFNMSEHPATDVVSDTTQQNSPFSLKSKGIDRLIPVAESANIGYPGFTQSGKALIFQYGIDDGSSNGKTVVVSNCSKIAKPTGTSVTDVSQAMKKLGNDEQRQKGNISILRHQVNAYAVGKIGDEQGLFRFQLNNGGGWGNPQLLVKKITRMDVRYIYLLVEKPSIPTTNPPKYIYGCPEDEDAGKEEKFKYTDKFDSSKDAVTPAGVEVLLDSGTNTKIAVSSDNNIYAYRIDATIRGGNVCANRTL